MVSLSRLDTFFLNHGDASSSCISHWARPITTDRVCLWTGGETWRATMARKAPTLRQEVSNEVRQLVISERQQQSVLGRQKYRFRKKHLPGSEACATARFLFCIVCMKPRWITPLR
ncbi:hypothetical protein NPIL_216051 [Nephila pilipes]|uniref:Uncharacterized protein n=1 Tax=Nephila pilipes TaxID=299642 RepID=A0A8X6NED3_NEPPI|nr:hypothetical protein NPIL_216051 [Nephila pilipes]